MSKKKEQRKERKKESKKNNFSKFFFLKKKVSQTPLELLENFKKSKKFQKWEKKEGKKIPLAYAGRLDPMASGKMLILAGQKCKEKEKFLNLDKEYLFEILLGFSSDTKDILGVVESDQNFYKRNDFQIFKKRYFFAIYLKKKLEEFFKKIKGKRKMQYPAFSSKTVEGKPLFLWALEQKIDQIKIPTKDIEIFDIKLKKIYFEDKKKIEKKIFKKIKDLKKVEKDSKALGRDFRRDEVLESWKKSLEIFPSGQKFLIIKIKTKVSSGTYMRNLAQEIAENLNTKGLAYSIKRTKFFL